MTNKQVIELKKVNKWFVIGYIKYLMNNRIEEFNELVDDFLKSNKETFVDFRSFPKSPIEKEIDEASGFQKEREKSFKLFTEYVYKLIWGWAE
jgi:hypothetical protein